MPRKTILLISANRFREPYPVYPLGVSYLKTYLVRHLDGFEVLVHDCNLDTDQDLAAVISREKPSYIGVSIRNIDGADSLREGNFMEGYSRLVRTIRALTPAPLIIGGAAFSMFPSEFMRVLEADYGITGEGEETFARLIICLENGEPVTDIEGLVIPSGDAVQTRGRTCHVVSPEVEFEDRLVDYYWRYSGMMSIQTKRGCPYGCVYCSYPVIDGRKVRVMDPEKVVENILRLKREKGVDYYFFTDSVFNIHDDFNTRLAEYLLEQNAGIRWGAYFSPHNISADKMGLYKASGLTHVEFGTESLSDECLAAYGKQFGFDEIREASRICLEQNIYYAHFLILGGYGETARTLRETMDRCRQLKHTVFFPFVGMRIYPDTRLREIAVAEGMIRADDNLLEPKYYISGEFDLAEAKRLAAESGKAWVFPDEVPSETMEKIRLKRNKKGPAWEYLRKP